MSILEKVWCDWCGKEVREGQNKRWIRINATEDYSVDIIEDEDHFTPIATEQLDFCSLKCLCRWFKNKVKEP